MLTVLSSPPAPHPHNCRIAYVDFKSQADAERALEEKQGTEVGGLAIVLDFVGKKSQGQEDRDRQSRTQRGKRHESSVD